jgi:hypothetical protein
LSFRFLYVLEVQGLREGHLRGSDRHHKASEYSVLQLQGDGCDITNLL